MERNQITVGVSRVSTVRVRAGVRFTYNYISRPMSKFGFYNSADLVFTPGINKTSDKTFQHGSSSKLE